MNVLNAAQFKEMLKSGYNNLANNAAFINTLNVFPVPDGDTGSNMSMTFENGYQEANKCDADSIGEVAKALSRGLLMGARGNSGVITSQIFRGFYQAIEDKQVANVYEIADGFENGARVAYKAIMKPVEGTILTVIREAAWYVKHDYETNGEFDLETYFDKFLKYAEESLSKTPDLLPVLKEVGVVDSGGQGLVKIIEGFKLYIDGKPVELLENVSELEDSRLSDLENEEFGYCTEFILRLSDEYLKNFDELRFRKKLNDLGTSLVVVQDEDLVKVHVHTLEPGNALNIGQRYGEFIKLKIENMQEQHNHIVEMAQGDNKPKERKAYGIISVAAGSGLTKMFYELNCDIVISGGQTMNPSTEDFVDAINTLENVDNIFIFPNNSNIILAANQAKDILKDRNVVVIETKSIPEGLSCIGVFNKEASVEDNIETIKEVKDNVYSASLTYAIKDTSFESIEVKEGDYIAMAGKKMVAASKDKLEVIYKLLDSLFEQGKDLITIIIGQDNAEDEIGKITEYIEKNSDLEIDILKGEQPVYNYLIGLE